LAERIEKIKMIIYSILIILPFILTYIDIKFDKKEKFKIDILWISYLLFSLFIFGTRYQIGGDWNNYYAAFLAIDSNSLIEQIRPGFNSNKIKLSNYEDSIIFYLLNVVIKYLFNSFVIFNLICSIIFIYSINKFCQILNSAKYLVYGYFTSYLFIIVHLGYVRQSLAISVLALSLYFYLKNKTINSFIYFLISTQIHIITSSFVPLFIKFKNVYLIITFLLLSIILLIFAWDKVYLYYYYYLGEGVHFQSRGSYARVLLNIPFFWIFFLLRKQLKISKKEYLFFKINLFILIFSIFCLLIEKTTLADRVALQLILFQGYTIGKIFNNLKIKFIKNIFILLTYILSFSQFLVWESFTKFQDSWIPYKNIIFPQ
jgi:hypothetical protein